MLAKMSIEQYGTLLGVLLIGLGQFVMWLKSRKGIVATKAVTDDITQILKGQADFKTAFNDRLTKMELDLRDVKYELTYNGGNSTKDQIRELTRLSEARFYTSHNLSPIPIYNCNSNGEWVFANIALCELFGMHYSEFKKNGWIKAVGKDQAERELVFTNWVHAVQNDIPYSETLRITNQKTFEKFDCEISIYPQRDATGQVLFYTGTVKLLNHN